MLLGPLLVTALAANAPAIAATNPEAAPAIRQASMATLAPAVADDPDPIEAESRGAVRITEMASAGSEADRGGLVFSATSMPTQTLPGMFNPANSHHNRSVVGASSEMASASWTDPDGQWWQPGLSYVLEQDRSPVVSGFGPSGAHAAEMRSTLVSHNVASEWSASALRLGFRLTSAEERSAEAGSFGALSRSAGGAGYVAWQILDSLALQFDQGEDRIRGLVDGSKAVWRSQTVSAHWDVRSGFALDSSYYRGRSLAGDAMPAMTTRVADVSLDYSFASASARGDGTGAHAYLRLQRQTLDGDGIAFTAGTPASAWGMSIGFAMPF